MGRSRTSLALTGIRAAGSVFKLSNHRQTGQQHTARFQEIAPIWTKESKSLAMRLNGGRSFEEQPSPGRGE
jgi:hypothetical protein